VNLIALLTRFITTCRSRVESLHTISGTSGATSHSNSRPFSSARIATVFNVDSSESCRLKSTASRSILPASICEKSRMSLITVNSESDEAFSSRLPTLAARCYNALARAMVEADALSRNAAIVDNRYPRPHSLTHHSSLVSLARPTAPQQRPAHADPQHRATRNPLARVD